MTTRKIRLLCLHGARASSDVTRMQMEVLGLVDADDVELCYLDAPFATATGFDSSFAGGRSWQNYEANPPGTPEARAELAESLASVAAHVQQHGPFDGAFGFSQGAAVITILSDARVWKEMGLQAAPWRFVVLACGVDYLVREHTGVEVCCTVPSLHLLGDADPFLMESELLLGRFNDRVGVALRHPFGHALPLELAIRHPEHLEAVVEFIREQAAAAPATETPPPAAARRGGLQPFFAVALVVVAAAAWWVVPTRAAPIVAQRPEVWEWRALAAAAARGAPPDSPVLVRGSPMQSALAAHPETWTVEAVRRLAAGAAGEYLVKLQSQEASASFLYHRESLGGVEVSSTARQNKSVVSLREATELLWPPPPRTGSHHHYLSARVDDLPPALVEAPLRDLLPDSCLPDTRLRRCCGVGGAEVEEAGPCRDLSALMWFGGDGVRATVHYDGTANLYLQADGRKRFTLLPPNAARALRLHPRWHGSSRQAQQTELGAVDWAAHGIAPLEATLQPGDVLHVPAFWFHQVEGVGDSVAVNLWTASFARDVWGFVAGGDDPERWPLLAPCRGGAGGAAVLRCVGERTAQLLGLVEAAGGRALRARADALLASRYAALEGSDAPEAAAADAARALCREAAAQPGAADGDRAVAPAIVHSYAAALRAADDATRELLLDDLVESAAAWAVGALGDRDELIREHMACFAAMGERL